MSCRAAAAAAAALRAETHARAAGDDVLAAWVRGQWGLALSFGPTPAVEAIEAVQPMFDGAASILERAEAERALGMLFAMRGEIEEAREHAQSAIHGTREAGQLVEAGGFAMLVAFVETHADNPAAAEDALRRGVVELDRLGNRSYRGTTALLLADALASRGAFEEAARWCAEVRESLNEDDLTDAVSVDSLEGFLLSVAGSDAEGELLSNRAVGRAAAIDFYDQKGRAYEWHSRTLALVGKPEEARMAAATALAIYEAKGDIPASAWARELLDSLSP
jgi:tetratricopeptide (TPR) repeat protein